MKQLSKDPKFKFKIDQSQPKITIKNKVSEV